MNHRHLQTWLLRIAAAVELGAFVAVVMPRQWMETGHEWLGLGAMPAGPLLDFMIRQTSFTYGLHGVLLWLLSRDVLRFRPLVIFTGVSYVLAAPVFVLIDVGAGMPWFWTLGDGGACFCLGSGLLWLDWRSPATDSRSEGFDSTELLVDLDHLKSLLLECRAVFPSLREDLIGKQVFSTAPYYQRRGYHAQIQLKDPFPLSSSRGRESWGDGSTRTH